ncbi:MAG: signal peptidase I [Myxococcota bacterium]
MDNFIDEDTGEVTEPMGFTGWLWDVVKTWVPALLMVLLIRSVLAEPFRIPSGSMVPTLEIGDHILVTKYSYGWRIPLTRIPIGEVQLPERGDVVVFVYPDSDEGKMSYWLDLPIPPIATLDYVKRVVGLPGDTIDVRNNVLYVNGKPQRQELTGPHPFTDDGCNNYPTRRYVEDLEGHDHDILTATTYSSRQINNRLPMVVPEGEIFAMGDNRDHSSDSRRWGTVPLRNLKGKARFVWLSYDQCKKNIPLLGDIRADRFGEPIR